MMTCGEVLAKLLEAYGIDTVFGIPGVHTVELYRGLPDTGIRHITPRHEQGAGFMADGFARACSRPAACFIITGPGMTNIATAMAQALADSIPMLVISSVNNTHELGMGEGRLHELPDQSALISGVSVFSHRLLRAEELPGVIAGAFAVFDGAKPGPVHIELPLDVITAPLHLPDPIERPRLYRPSPDAQAIDAAVALLSDATHPMIVLGGGSAPYGSLATRLVDTLDIPTVLTINAKGVLKPDHPLNLNSTLGLDPVLQAVQGADVVLAIGTELGETDTLRFDAALNLSGKLIRIDIDPRQLVRNALPCIGICADAGQAMQALLAAAQSATAQRDGAQRAAQLREHIADALSPRYRAHGQFLQALGEALPNAIIVGDSTQPVYGGNFTYAPQQAASWFNSATGYGTLGYALSAALGACLACPERPVVCLIGDGGLQFTIGELATAVELQLPLCLLIWNNSGYGEIKEYMQARDLPTIGVDIHTPDFIAIARGYGCKALTLERPEQLAEAVSATQTHRGPTVIDIRDADARQWWS